MGSSPFAGSNNMQITTKLLTENYWQKLEERLRASNVRPSLLITPIGYSAFQSDDYFHQRVVAVVKEALERDYKDNSSEKEDWQILGTLSKFDSDLKRESLLQTKTLDDMWQLQFNRIRNVRPKRGAAAKVDSIYKEFSDKDFNFTKVPDEKYLEVEFLGQPVSFFYNKYPFGPYHSSVIPRLEEKHPQYLDANDHYLAWSISQGLNQDGEGGMLAYNAHGAYASVNQLHFQLLFDPNLSLFNQGWRHNGGKNPYPATVITFSDPQESWRLIDEFQDSNQPFNLLYTQDKVYVLPRRFQGDSNTPAWSSGFGWLELAGKFIVTEESDLKKVDAGQIESALADTSVPV